MFILNYHEVNKIKLEVTQMKKLFISALVLMVAVLVLIGAGSRNENNNPGDIVDIAVEDGRFTTLVTALEAADLVSTLKGEGPFTVFAPTDDAFAELPEGTVEALLKDIPQLKVRIVGRTIS